MYRSVQIKAGVSQPTQLLIDMKVRWSSMYIMLNCAEANKEVRILYHCTFNLLKLTIAIACWHFCVRDRSSRAQFGQTHEDRLSSTLDSWMDTRWPICGSPFICWCGPASIFIRTRLNTASCNSGTRNTLQGLVVTRWKAEISEVCYITPSSSRKGRQILLEDDEVPCVYNGNL